MLSYFESCLISMCENMHARVWLCTCLRNSQGIMRWKETKGGTEQTEIVKESYIIQDWYYERSHSCNAVLWAGSGLLYFFYHTIWMEN